MQTHLEHDRVKSNGRWLYHWRVFSHKDWNVIGPIAARYKMMVNFRNNIAFLPGVLHGSLGDTPQRAIALAVIQRAKK